MEELKKELTDRYKEIAQVLNGEMDKWITGFLSRVIDENGLDGPEILFDEVKGIKKKTRRNLTLSGLVWFESNLPDTHLGLHLCLLEKKEGEEIELISQSASMNKEGSLRETILKLLGGMMCAGTGKASDEKIRKLTRMMDAEGFTEGEKRSLLAGVWKKRKKNELIASYEENGLAEMRKYLGEEKVPSYMKGKVVKGLKVSGNLEFFDEIIWEDGNSERICWPLNEDLKTNGTGVKECLVEWMENEGFMNGAGIELLGKVTEMQRKGWLPPDCKEEPRWKNEWNLEEGGARLILFMGDEDEMKITWREAEKEVLNGLLDEIGKLWIKRRMGDGLNVANVLNMISESIKLEGDLKGGECGKKSRRL